MNLNVQPIGITSKANGYQNKHNITFGKNSKEVARMLIEVPVEKYTKRTTEKLSSIFGRIFHGKFADELIAFEQSASGTVPKKITPDNSPKNLTIAGIRFNRKENAGDKLAQILAERQGLQMGKYYEDITAQMLGESLDRLGVIFGEKSDIAIPVLGEKVRLKDLIDVKIALGKNGYPIAIVKPGSVMKTRINVDAVENKGKFRPIICTDTTANGKALVKNVEHATVRLVMSYENALLKDGNHPAAF